MDTSAARRASRWGDADTAATHLSTCIEALNGTKDSVRACAAAVLTPATPPASTFYATIFASFVKSAASDKWLFVLYTLHDILLQIESSSPTSPGVNPTELKRQITTSILPAFITALRAKPGIGPADLATVNRLVDMWASRKIIDIKEESVLRNALKDPASQIPPVSIDVVPVGVMVDTVKHFGGKNYAVLPADYPIIATSLPSGAINTTNQGAINKSGVDVEVLLDEFFAEHSAAMRSIDAEAEAAVPE